MEQQNNGKMFDSRTIFAILVVGGIFFGWQYYLKNKYPAYYAGKKPEQAKELAKKDGPGGTLGVPQGTTELSVPPGTEAATPVKFSERIYDVETEEFKADLTSAGMGLKNILLKKHTDRLKNPMMLVQSGTATFATALLGQQEPISFEITKEAPLRFIGRAVVGGATITKIMSYDAEAGFWTINVSLANVPAGFPGLTTLVTEKRTIETGGSFFAPSLDHQEIVMNPEGSIKRLHAAKDLDSPDEVFKNVGFAAIGLVYFTTAIVDKSQLAPEIVAHIPDVSGKDMIVELRHRVQGPAAKIDFEMKAYSGPKIVEKLEAVDPQLSKAVDFGFFNTIGRILRTVLHWFHGFVGNWGVAIILLTIVVRILVLPFNIISYRSMRAMQAIQPAMASVKEKYKDDPVALQRETMALMKENKVNPFGGCLPMLLQMPIFFALFQVLGHSVELYQAPFYFWIQDLSLKDPYFILPVLIGGLMYMQQQLTPMTNMDPAQAKVLKWMPLLFVVFMISLPAGLSIYTFVNTLFGVTQQYFFLKDTRRKTANLQAARASN